MNEVNNVSERSKLSERVKMNEVNFHKRAPFILFD